jgi:hypothetical protein
MKQYKEELFIYKYRPQTLNELNRPDMSVFSNIIEHKTIPNMIIYGVENSGKHTALYAFLKSRFGNLNTRCTYKEFKINVKPIKIPVFYSQYHIEIDVLSFYSHIRTLLPKIIKDITQSKNICSNDHKIIVIHHTESLEEQSQHMLRRILEVYIKNCRFIFITNKLNKITQPLKKDNVKRILFSINNKLDIPVAETKVCDIISKTSNIKDAIYNLEFAYYNIGEYDNYNKELYNFIHTLKNAIVIDATLYKYIDDYLYECLYKNISLDTLILNSFTIVKKLVSSEKQRCLLDTITYYDETITQGDREYMHVQSLFYYYMVLFHPED